MAIGERDRNSHGDFKLHLIIIGAGLAGLAAAISTRLEGHDVTILEKVSKLQEVGAGLQITPNATRLFRRWGIFDELQACAAAPLSISVRRYDGTLLLAKEDDFQEKIVRRYGAPFWDLHRADLQAAMVGRAVALGVNIRLSADVVQINFQKAEVTIQGGEVVGGDIILGADGLWSRSRNLFLNKELPPQPTGDLAYRIVLNLDEITDPELREWVSTPTVNFWIGPYAHAVGYSLRGGEMYNLVLLRPDDLPENVSRAPGKIEELMELMKSWDPM